MTIPPMGSMDKLGQVARQLLAGASNTTSPVTASLTPQRLHGHTVSLFPLPRPAKTGRVPFVWSPRRWWMLRDSPDDVATLVTSVYSGLKFQPPPGQFTILAGFVLQNAESLKVISIGTGSKCLPATRLPRCGDALHDSHAEVLARRGAIRWFMEELARSEATPQASMPSRWIHRDTPYGKYSLRLGVTLTMYISTVPCGDASTRFLAAAQDAVMAALKDSAPRLALPPSAASRGRDDYARLGVLRTKPGRADAPPTLSLSCSDKIAAWNVLGVLGALPAPLFEPVYIARVVLGEVPPDMQGAVHADCERALFGRLRALARAEGALPQPFRVNEPTIGFTAVPFVHARSSLSPTPTSGCNDSLCWIADSPTPREVLINGIRRGVPPKHLQNPKFRPLLSKVALYALFEDVARTFGVSVSDGESYCEAKQRDPGYVAARLALKGAGGPFEGWVTSGREWEDFDVEGRCLMPSEDAE